MKMENIARGWHGLDGCARMNGKDLTAKGAKEREEKGIKTQNATFKEPGQAYAKEIKQTSEVSPLFGASEVLHLSHQRDSDP